MEFPDLGKTCTHESCNMLDFLPYNCVYCHKVYCQDHFKLEAHQCPSLKDPKRDIRVPVCPVCDQPVPVNKGQDPNHRMNQHILSNCSDLPKKSDNTCNRKHCHTKMLVPMHCTDCGLSFCVKHRFPVDHQCTRRKPVIQQQKAVKTTFTKTTTQASQEIARLQAKVIQGIITDHEQMRLATLLSLNEKDNRLSVY